VRSSRSRPGPWAARRALLRARRAAGLLLALLLAALPGCGEAATAGATTAAPAAPAAARRNVLLVCLDTVRADRLGCYGYRERPTTPALDELAARSTLFRDTSATAGWTKPSVPSFLTGSFPCQHGVYEGSARGLSGTITHLLPAAAGTLAERFQAAGYVTGAVIHNAQLRRGGGFEQGFDSFDDEGGDARDIRARAARWLDAHGDRPFFLYLHFLDAHWPCEIPDEAARRFTSGDVDFFRSGDSRALRDAINGGLVTLDDGQRATLSALYDGALRFLDDELGALFADLRQRGLSDDTLLCIVADHGEEFLEHGRIGHGHGVWQNLLAVPWILHVPGRVPQEVTTPVSLVDLAPTLLAAAGLPADGAGEGLDRLALPGRPAAILAEHKAPDRYVQSVRSAGLKLVRDWRPPARAASSDSDDEAVLAAAAALLRTGTRWEAELLVRPDGPWLATQLKPREEPAGDPLELKARISGLRDGAFLLAGVAVRLAPGATFSGEAALAQAGLREGLLVKARGTVAEGALLCERLKFYADEPGPPEARGTVEALQLDGAGARVRLSGLWIAFDGNTQWKAVALPAGVGGDPPSFPREELAAALELGADGALRAGWTIDCSLYDLHADPGEQAPVARWSGPLQAATHDDIRRLSEAADARVRDLLARRTWSAGDEAALGASAVDDLRQIGYVR
jgi:arylsulfatase